jgi:hypothetical protein
MTSEHLINPNPIIHEATARKGASKPSKRIEAVRQPERRNEKNKQSPATDYFLFSPYMH